MSKNLIVKNNELINAKFKLSLQNHRILFLAMSKINPLQDCGIDYEKRENRTFKFTIEEYAQEYQISKNRAYSLIKESLEDIFTTSIIEKNEHIESRFHLVERENYFVSEGRFEIIFSIDSLKYLVNQRKYFTKFALENVKSLRSSYSIRLYELLIQFIEMKKTQNQKNKRTFQLDELKDKLGAYDLKAYDKFEVFERKVLKTSINDINKNSNLHVSMKKIKKGRKIDSLEFEFYIFKINEPYLKARPRVAKGSHLEGEWLTQRINTILDFLKSLKDKNQDLRDDRKIFYCHELFKCYQDLGDHFQEFDYLQRLFKLDENYKKEYWGRYEFLKDYLGSNTNQLLII